MAYEPCARRLIDRAVLTYAKLVLLERAHAHEDAEGVGRRQRCRRRLVHRRHQRTLTRHRGLDDELQQLGSQLLDE